MNIAWITPLKKSSAIGKIGLQVAEELSRQHDVVLWTADLADTLSSKLEVRALRNDARCHEELAKFEARFFNFGNCLPYHETIFEVSRHVSGIAILHDMVMHHFLFCYYQHHQKLHLYYDLLKIYHGEAVAKQAARLIKSDPEFIHSQGEFLSAYPLMEPFLKTATGAFVHSQYHLNAIKPLCLGPTAYHYLPHKISHPARHKPTGAVRLLTTGIIHPQKQIEKILRALAASQYKGKFHYTLAGAPFSEEFGKLLRKLIGDLGLDECVSMLGWTEEKKFHQLLEEADICINLRFPNNEGCSLSLVEQFCHGKPTVAYDTAFYGEMPEDCLKKLPPSCSIEDLRRSLDELIGNLSVREAYAASINKFSENAFTMEGYIEALMGLALDSQKYEPRLKLIRQLVHEAASGLQPDCQPGSRPFEESVDLIASSL